MKYLVCMSFGLLAGIAIQALPVLYACAAVGLIIGFSFVAGGEMK